MVHPPPAPDDDVLPPPAPVDEVLLPPPLVELLLVELLLVELPLVEVPPLLVAPPAPAELELDVPSEPPVEPELATLLVALDPTLCVVPEEDVDVLDDALVPVAPPDDPHATSAVTASTCEARK